MRKPIGVMAYILALVQDAGTVQALSNPNIRLTMFAPGEAFKTVSGHQQYISN